MMSLSRVPSSVEALLQETWETVVVGVIRATALKALEGKQTKVAENNNAGSDQVQLCLSGVLHV